MRLSGVYFFVVCFVCHVHFVYVVMFIRQFIGIVYFRVTWIYTLSGVLNRLTFLGALLVLTHIHITNERKSGTRWRRFSSERVCPSQGLVARLQYIRIVGFKKKTNSVPVLRNKILYKNGKNLWTHMALSENVWKWGPPNPRVSDNCCYEIAILWGLIPDIQANKNIYGKTVFQYVSMIFPPPERFPSFSSGRAFLSHKSRSTLRSVSFQRYRQDRPNSPCTDRDQFSGNPAEFWRGKQGDGKCNPPASGLKMLKALKS